MKKSLRRFFAVVLAVAMLATYFVVPSFAATTGYCKECGDKGVVGALLHTIDPTCEDGYEIYECDYVEKGKNCPGTITVRVPANGDHASDVLVKAVDATCTTTGNLAYETCKVCEKHLDPTTHVAIDSFVDKLGHDYVPTVTDPDCVNGGYTTYVCSRCEDTYVDDKVDCLGHDFSKKIPEKPATCRTEGYKEYYVCSRCDVEDPENPKVILPIEDHNLKLIDHKDATCTAAGYNTFKCEKATCPYYAGIQENLAKLGHAYVQHAAVAATCEEPGNVAYRTCERCDYISNRNYETAPLGHTEVNVEYKAPTCRETGLANAIVCDREGCGYIHHPGEVVPALGHDLTNVVKVDPTCSKAGNIEHEHCSVCNKNFPAGTKNADVDVDPLNDVTVKKLGHAYEEITIDPTCVEQGYIVKTCSRENCDNTDKKGTVSEPIAATGHTFEKVAKVEPTCLVTGTEEHNKCTVCGNLYEIDVDKMDIKAAAVDLVDLEIAALGHKSEIVEQVLPTYNNDGHEAGERCERCHEPLNGAAYLDELKEAVKFHYEIAGVNNAKNAVNSGYVTLKVYFDVLKDEVNDKKEYNSDVLANIFGVDFAMNYDADAFELAAVEVAPGAFAKAEFTPLKDANKNGEVKISQDMVTAAKEFRGEDNLFATLTFKVADDAAAGTYSFAKTNLAVVHPEKDEKEVDATASVGAIEIQVKKLGDANTDTVFTSHDTLEISKYIQGADLDTEYVAEYDMDKDGDIDFIDLDLLRKAIVGNDEYLTIPE